MGMYITTTDLNQGDPVCLVPRQGGPRFVARATMANLEGTIDAPGPRALLGVSRGNYRVRAGSQTWADIADGGIVGNDVTHLGTGSHSLVCVSRTEPPRCERVMAPQPGDYIVGVAMPDGSLVVQCHCEVWDAENRIRSFLDFGGIGDGQTDNTGAFEAAMAAMDLAVGEQTGRLGNTLYFPPGRYYFADDMNITRAVHLRGASQSSTFLIFAPGKGMIVHGYRTSIGPVGTTAAGSLIEQVHIFGDAPVVQEWQPHANYAVGAKTWLWDLTGKLYYLECVRAGMSGGSLPLAGGLPDEVMTWEPHREYHARGLFPSGAVATEGAVVRGTNIFDVVFVCTVAGESGSSEPGWDTTPGHTTGEGRPTWAMVGDSPTAPYWTAHTTYTAGTVVRSPNIPGIAFRCGVAGESGAREPNWNRTAAGALTEEGARWTALPASARAVASRWSRGSVYSPGTMVYVDGVEDVAFRCVQGGTADQAPGGARYDLLFECTHEGRSADHDEPAWDLTPGHDTIEGPSWQAVSGSPSSYPAWHPFTNYTTETVRSDRVAGVAFRCTRPGFSGAVEPSWDTTPDNITQEGPAWKALATSLDNVATVQAWGAKTWYSRGDRVRRSAAATMIPDGPSGPQWIPVPAPYFTRESASGGAMWLVRASNGIRMHAPAVIRDVAISGPLNAGIHISAYTPQDNANNWRLENLDIQLVGVGVFVVGIDSNAGLASKVSVANVDPPIGTVRPPHAWLSANRTLPGVGAPGILDRSFLGCNWVGCSVEVASGRAYLIESADASGALIACYSEAAQPSYLSWRGIVVGGTHGAGIHPSSGTGMASAQDFKYVQETLDQVPLRPRASLIDQDIAFAWSSDANPDNTFGWRYRSPYGSPLGEPAWTLSATAPNIMLANYLALSDGFSEDGWGWRDVNGHYCGYPGFGNGFFLGHSYGMDTSLEVRRGVRFAGDRFEYLTNEDRGRRGAYIGKVVTRDGYTGAGWLRFSPAQYEEAIGYPAITVDPGNGYVYACTRTPQGSPVQPSAWHPHPWSPDPQDARYRPVQGVPMTWRPLRPQRVGYLKRPETPNGFYYRCTEIYGYGVTGGVPPVWPVPSPDNLHPTVDEVQVNPDAAGNPQRPSRIVWQCAGRDDLDAVHDMGAGGQWTCLGPAAQFAPYGPIYEKGTAITTDDTPMTLDVYAIPDRACTQYDVTVTAYQLKPAAPSPDGADAATFNLRAIYRRTDPYVHTVIGSTDLDPHPNDYPPPWHATLEQDGASVVLRVQGAPATTIEWKSIRLPT